MAGDIDLRASWENWDLWHMIHARFDAKAVMHLIDTAVTDLLIPSAVAHAPAMFTVTEAEAAAIRQVFERDGEFAAAVELRRLFPGIRDNAQAREWVRTIAGWKP